MTNILWNLLICLILTPIYALRYTFLLWNIIWCVLGDTNIYVWSAPKMKKWRMKTNGQWKSTMKHCKSTMKHVHCTLYSAYPICNFHVQPATMEKFNIVIKCWQKKCRAGGIYDFYAKRTSLLIFNFWHREITTMLVLKVDCGQPKKWQSENTRKPFFCQKLGKNTPKSWFCLMCKTDVISSP